ncbi:unnamed protein product, partial [Menidia menidia]
DVEEGDLDARLYEEADQLDAVAELGLVLALALLAVRHVHDHHERRAGDEDELQGPQADVGDGEEVVVADVGAAGLLGVAVEVLLLVAPHPLRRHHVHHHPEHEHHRQPYAPKRRGVLVHPAEEGLKGLPVHALGRHIAGPETHRFRSSRLILERRGCAPTCQDWQAFLLSYLGSLFSVSQDTATLYEGAGVSGVFLPISFRVLDSIRLFPLDKAVEDFKDGEEDAGQAGDHHEDGEDPLLRGPRDEAVHLVGTGLLLTLDERGEVVALVDVVEQVDEGGVDGYFEEQREDVGPPQASALFARVLVETLAVLAVLVPVLFFPFLPVGHVHHHQERRTGDEYELQGPQADVGHGEEVVIADVVAPGLSCVTFEVFLFIAPDLLCCHDKHHDSEEKYDGEPHSPESCGVLIHPAEEALEECPVHDEVCSQSVFSA